MDKKWLKRRKRLFDITEVGNDLDLVSRSYDYISALSIILNLIVSILYTYADLRTQYGMVFLWVERITVAFF